ncbi:MAG: hypothetical protein LBL15_04405, partial [Oscillospiraceae bacterium]|nr:hypothetical protein [Oscillospiraceae bacterium]
MNENKENPLKDEADGKAEATNAVSTETTGKTDAPEETAQPEAVEISAKTPDPEEAKTSVPKMSARLKKALLRAGAALIAALALLYGTKLSFLDLIAGAAKTGAVQTAEPGAFVKCDILVIFGTYAEEKSGGTTTGQYAVVPMEGKLVTVRITGRYLESAEAVETDTYDYISGSLSSLDRYFVVQGTAETLSEECSAQLYEWFAANEAWLAEIGFIAAAGDASFYLSDAVLMTDTVNSMNQTLVVVLTGLAILCLLYVVIELILMAVGFYLDRQERPGQPADGPDAAKNSPSDEAPPEVPAAAGGTPQKDA